MISVEETIIQENTTAQPEGSGIFAQKYTRSFLVILTAFFAAIYGGFNFYELFNRLQKSGFDAKFWYVDLIYVFGYTFLCVGLFSNIGKNKPIEKLTSNLHTAQLGLGALGAANIFYLVRLFTNYFNSGKLGMTPTLELFFKQFGNTEQVINYTASALASLFAILLVKNVIDTLKGDPAGKVFSILTSLFSLASCVALLMVIITIVRIFLPLSPLPFFKTLSNVLLTEDALLIVSKIVFMLFAALGAIMWLPKAAKINRFILNDEPEAEEIAEKTEVSEEK